MIHLVYVSVEKVYSITICVSNYIYIWKHKRLFCYSILTNVAFYIRVHNKALQSRSIWTFVVMKMGKQSFTVWLSTRTNLAECFHASAMSARQQVYIVLIQQLIICNELICNLPPKRRIKIYLFWYGSQKYSAERMSFYFYSCGHASFQDVHNESAVNLRAL